MATVQYTSLRTNPVYSTTILVTNTAVVGEKKTKKKKRKGKRKETKQSKASCLSIKLHNACFIPARFCWTLFLLYIKFLTKLECSNAQRTKCRVKISVGSRSHVQCNQRGTASGWQINSTQVCTVVTSNHTQCLQTSRLSLQIQRLLALYTYFMPGGLTLFF